MSFDSPSFWLFVLALWCVCQLVRHNGARKLLLITASYLIYASLFPAHSMGVYVLLLATVTAGSFAAVRFAKGGHRRRILLAGIWTAVGGLAAAKAWLNPLPVGLSFYVLQAIAWMVEAYRSVPPGKEKFLDFALYMSFFSRLAAGPIVRADEFLPQLAKRPVVDSAALWEGLTLVVFGLFKKLALADNLALAVDPVFADLHASPSRILLATYGFAAQIYCDFSGYSDMALGTARLFGYRLPENFNWPYLARNPADFWRRWHISLSNWLRDYVYFSLPGHRAKSRIPTYLNLTITMAACGLWHGFRWPYLLWGLYHGTLLATYYAIRKPAERSALGTLGSIFLMQQLAVIGWILFRVNRVSDLGVYVANMAGGPFFTGFSADEWMALAVLGAVGTFHLIEPSSSFLQTMRNNRWNPWLCTILLLIAAMTALLSVPRQQTFLYFRF